MNVPLGSLADNHLGGFHTWWMPLWDNIRPSLLDATSHEDRREVGHSDSGI